MDFGERHHGFSLSDIAYRLSGKKAVVESEVINGRKLNVIFTFFSKASFESDQKEWADYQKKVYAAREKGQKEEGFKFYDFYNTLRRKIGYSEFIKISIPFFSRIIFQAFADHPDFFYDKKEITVQVMIKPAGRWEEETKGKFSFAGAYPYSPVEMFADKALKEGILDMDNYYTQFSGFYVLQAIVAPHIFFRRIDYNFLYKFIVHELDHYHTCALNYYSYERGLKDRLGPNDMVLTYEEFASLWKQAEKNYDAAELAKVKKAGYYPID
ncbi:hypothetical protein HYU17_04580 [Candidatus Woesearchaeota archaeon]|nr:hypothetical protein [Candidatus Woesearchaeota archaeon]